MKSQDRSFLIQLDKIDTNKKAGQTRLVHI